MASQTTKAPEPISLPLQATQELPVWSPVDHEPDKRSLKELIERLDTVRAHAGQLEERFAAEIGATDGRFRESARNLLHYLALRHFDLRNIQERLAALGLSRLARTEPHTLASVYAVRRALERAARKHVTDRLEPEPGVAFGEGTRLLADHTHELLGSEPHGRDVRIMVTLPSEAADDYELVRGLMAVGMDCARINCAHDGPDAWARMIDNIARAKRELGQYCKISMDLGGPKLRTGKLKSGPRVVKWSPARDVRGQVVAPARIWFAPPDTRPPAGSSADAVLPVTAEWLSRLEVGDKIELVDARDAHRKIRIIALEDEGCWGETRHSAYVETGTVLTRRPAEKQEVRPGKHTVLVGEVPPVEIPIVLAVGDTLVLHRDPKPGAPAVLDADGQIVTPAHISCTMTEVFTNAKPGELIRLDDGKMEGVIREVSEDEMRIEIALAKPGGAKLRGDKGLNFPDSRLEVAALTPKDLTDLDFVARHADMVAMSFVNDPSDVLQLQEELTKRGGGHLGIVLKIETKQGFQQLPWLLLAAMRSYPVGVMIARGDLAVELGWERLAEVQEEILWLCEAAHVPVIWATQVLEQMAKKGLPSRAEITDAAMSVRAECVMLNKGPYINRVVETLDHILTRMQEHQVKKGSTLRNLTLAGNL